MAKTPTTITTTGGKRVSGYIEGGKTYYSSGKRIGEGDTVTTSSGKEYVMKGGVGVPTGANYSITGTQGAYKPTSTPTTAEDAYAKIAEQQRRALETQTQQAIAKQQAIRPQIEQGYTEQARQANILARQQELAMPERLSAQGITGGGTQSAMIQQQAELGENLKDIGLQKQTALSSLDQSIANIQSESDIQKAQLEAENQLKTLEAYKEKLAQEKQDTLSTLGAYGADYMARINTLQNDNDTSNDWQIPYFQQARQQKLAGIAESEASAEETAYKRALDQAKLDLAYAKLNKSGKSSGSSTSGVTKDAAYAEDYTKASQGTISPETIKSNMQSIIAQYGTSKYNALLKAATDNYNVALDAINAANRQQEISQRGSWKGSIY